MHLFTRGMCNTKIRARGPVVSSLRNVTKSSTLILFILSYLTSLYFIIRVPNVCFVGSNQVIVNYRIQTMLLIFFNGFRLC